MRGPQPKQGEDVVVNSPKIADRQFKPGEHIQIKGRIEEATVKAVQQSDGIRLQVDFGHDQSAGPT